MDKEPTLVVIDGKLVKTTDVVQPILEIVGPAGPAPAGEVLVLEAKISNEYMQFIKVAKIKWNVTEGNVKKQIWNDGKKVVFGTGVKDSVIDVAATLTLHYDVNGESVIKVLNASKKVQVTTTPIPIPASVASLVSSWAKDPAVVPQNEHTREAARAISLSFKKVSNEINSGLLSIKDIMVRTKTYNDQALSNIGADPHAWESWAKNLQDLIRTKTTNGELINTEHYKKLWWDISAGLWSV